MSSAIEQLPTSAILSVGLKKRGNIAEDSGGTADIWRGEYRGTQVAIKAFRVSRNLKEAKEVRTEWLRDVYHRTKFTDPVETCARVEEIVPRKRPAVLWRGHDALSARPRLPLGGKREHQPVHSVTSRRISTLSGAEGSDYCGDYNELLTIFPLFVVAIWCREGATIPSFA